MITLAAIAVALAVPLIAADAAHAPWIMASPQTGMVVAVRPEIHSVVVTTSEVVIRSAGLSLAYLGPLQSPPVPGEGVQSLEFRIPRAPREAKGRYPSLPAGAAGVFLNGMPVWNAFEASSFEGRNIWHYDPLAQRPGSGHAAVPGLLEDLLTDRHRHSPLVGYALDGYPIYGPWAVDEKGSLRRMRSGYRLRAIAERLTLAGGKALTPGQYGPPVNAAFPLGTFAEDYEYVKGVGELDEFNGRVAITPEYPGGTYGYFLASDDDGRTAFPYLLASHFRGTYNESTPAASVLASFGRAATHHQDGPLRTGVPARFELSLLSREGRRVRSPEYVHERPIHLMIVSVDRGEFAHIHPEVGTDDRWRVAHTFSYGGRYRVYVEFTLPGEAMRTEQFDVAVEGPARPASVPPMATPALLTLDAPGNIRTHEDADLHFRVAGNEDLQPWLGAWAHVAILGEGLSSFVHAHPLTAGASAIQESEAHTHAAQAYGPRPRQIVVPVSFATPGIYKLWVQVQVAGEVRTMPFQVRVSGAAVRGAEISQALPRGAIPIRVTAAGYSPARIEVPEGKPLTLAFQRTNEPNCGTKVVFAALGLTRDLPLGATTIVRLPPQRAGELRFACGMGMNRGSLIVR